MKIIPAENPQRGEIYIFKHCCSTPATPNKGDGNKVMVATTFDKHHYATAVDLDARVLIGVYKNELFVIDFE